MLDTRAAAAERLWTGSQSDANLAAELRAAYRGRFDVRDALWWRAHPLVPTPAGVPDPAADLHALSASVYSRESAGGPLVEYLDPVTDRPVLTTPDGRRLRELTIQLAQDAAAVDAAIDLVTRERPGHAAAVLPPQPSPAHPRPGVRHERGATVKRWQVAAGALAVAVVIGVGVPAAFLNPSSSTTAGTGVLAVFTDHARYPVVIESALGDRFNPDSIRSATPPGAAEAGYELFVAQNTDGDYCVVLQNLEGRLDTRCTSAVELASSGLRLDAIVIPPPSPLERSQPPTPFDVTVIWSTDGTFTAAFTPRSRLTGY